MGFAFLYLREKVISKNYETTSPPQSIK